MYAYIYIYIYIYIHTHKIEDGAAPDEVELGLPLGARVKLKKAIAEDLAYNNKSNTIVVWYSISYCMISYYIISYHIISYHIMPYHYIYTCIPL